MRRSSKEIGCCTICGKEVFEVIGRFPSDHPLAGEVCRVGRPLKNAVRTELVLMSGATASITTCLSCKVTPENLVEVWRTCCSANAQETEPDRRRALGAKPLLVDQLEQSVESIKEMVGDLPIAVISEMLWEEIL